MGDKNIDAYSDVEEGASADFAFDLDGLVDETQSVAK